MKKSIFMAMLLTLPLSINYSWADETNKSEKHKESAMTDKDKSMKMVKMQEKMLAMHEHMHKIMDAKTPQERESLMQEHTKMMQDNMHMMKGMSDSDNKDSMNDKMKKM